MLFTNNKIPVISFLLQGSQYLEREERERERERERVE